MKSKKVWAELKYGSSGHGITLCKLDNPSLLKAFKHYALDRAKNLVHESEDVDEVIHILDKLEFERLNYILNLLLPDKIDGKIL